MCRTKQKTMKVKIKWGVNMSSGSLTIKLEELGVASLEEWNSMDEETKKETAQEALYACVGVRMALDSYEIKE